MLNKTEYKLLHAIYDHARENKHYTKAIKTLTKYTKNHNDEYQVLNWLGELLDKRALQKKRSSDQRKAKLIYKNLIKKYPKLNGGYFGLIKLLLREKNKDAFKVAKKWLKISGQKEYNQYIGHCYKEFGDYKNAEKHYLLAYRHIKNHYGPDYALAVISQLLNKPKKALMYAKRAIAKYKKMPIRYRRSNMSDPYIQEMRDLIKKEA